MQTTYKEQMKAVKWALTERKIQHENIFLSTPYTLDPIWKALNDAYSSIYALHLEEFNKNHIDAGDNGITLK